MIFRNCSTVFVYAGQRMSVGGLSFTEKFSKLAAHVIRRSQDD